jgi:hypothetical protein
LRDILDVLGLAEGVHRLRLGSEKNIVCRTKKQELILF